MPRKVYSILLKMMYLVIFYSLPRITALQLNCYIFPDSTPSDSARSGSTLSNPSTSSLGKRKAPPTPSPLDSVVERPLKRACTSDKQTSRTELPQDPGAPYIIVRKK